MNMNQPCVTASHFMGKKLKLKMIAKLVEVSNLPRTSLLSLLLLLLLLEALQNEV